MPAPTSKREFYWPAALVLTIMLLGNVAIALLAPREERVELLAGFNLLCGVALAFMRALVGIAPAGIVLLAIGLGGATIGCGGASAEVREADRAELLRCMENEDAIRDRTGTSPEQDAADLAAERARCNAARAAIGGN